MANPEQFYCYLWLRDKDTSFAAGTPYYVGKGKGLRAFRVHRSLTPPVDKSNIIVMSRSSEQEAFESEKELIHNWGRADLGTGCLRNHTDGGGYPAEVITARNDSRSPEVRRNMSQGQKRRFSNSHPWNKGKTHCEESRAKMRVAAKKRFDEKEKNRLSDIGRLGANKRWGVSNGE